MMRDLMMRARMAGAAVAAAVFAAALLAGATPARGQCEAATEGEKVQRMMKLRDEILELETIKQQIEVEHHVLVTYPGGVVLVTPQQAGTLFGNAVFVGTLNPDSVQPRVNDLIAMTKIYLNDYILSDIKDKRECFERLNQGAPAASAPSAPPTPSAAASPIDWPVPMDWIAVKGAVRGSYVAECSGYREYPAFRSAGTWRLEFLGDGQVRGVFGDDARQYSGLGAIKADGSASGESRSTNAEVPHLSWSARFQRSGVDLVISSHKLDLMAAERGPHSILVECKPGYMRQE